MRSDYVIVGCISERTVNGCVQAINSAVEQGASMVELRIDYLNQKDPVSLQKIVSASHRPVIAACRKKKDGGLFVGNENERIEILKTVVKRGEIDYVDIEMDSSEKHIREIKELARASSCTVVVSKHYFKGTPRIETLTKWLDRASKLGDIVKIVTQANNAQDCTRILDLIEIANKKEIPIVAFAMGEKGKFTRVVSLFCGSQWTYCAVGKAVAPGQMTIGDVEESIRLLSESSSTL